VRAGFFEEHQSRKGGVHCRRDTCLIAQSREEIRMN
jgi:hypothetical protein